ncbi:MAG: hypothetical protein JNM90_15795 [Burkholderiales bacterium]|nr:hypothetical protein [Burkholderiales bacterium]
MNTTLFLVSIAMAVIGPAVALTYLRPILVKVLVALCDADGGAEFWVRSAYVLSISGTLMLVLLFGRFAEDSHVVDVLRRTMFLVLLGVFVGIAFIAIRVWDRVAASLKAAVDVPAAQ